MRRKHHPPAATSELEIIKTQLTSQHATILAIQAEVQSLTDSMARSDAFFAQLLNLLTPRDDDPPTLLREDSQDELAEERLSTQEISPIPNTSERDILSVAENSSDGLSVHSPDQLSVGEISTPAIPFAHDIPVIQEQPDNLLPRSSFGIIFHGRHPFDFSHSRT